MSASSQVVLITGCSAGGIGWSIANEFASKGYTVFATARNTAKIADIPGKVHKVRLDVADQKSVEDAVAAVVATAGRIDILVNNAGTNVATGPAVETDLQRYRDTFEANYFGLIRVTQAVTPIMIKQRSGKIVNFGSIAAYLNLPYSAAYCSSKAAVHSFTEILRHEVRGFGIDVVVIAPGAIESMIGEASAKDIHIPDSSPYKNVEDMVRARAAASQLPGKTPTQVFAKQVVSEVSKRSLPLYLTLGARSTKAWFFYYLPATLRGMIMSRMWQLWRIGK